MAKKSIKTEQLEETVGALHKELIDKNDKLAKLTDSYVAMENQLNYAKVDCESALIACNQCESDLSIATNEATRLAIANEKNDLVIKEYEGNVIQLIEDNELMKQRCINYEEQLIAADDEANALKDKVEFLLIDGLEHKSLMEHLMIWHSNTRSLHKVLSLIVVIYLFFAGAYVLYNLDFGWNTTIVGFIGWLSFVVNFLYYEN